MKTRDVKWFDSLKDRDFANGAVIDEIHAVFKERDALQEKVTELEGSNEQHLWLIWSIEHSAWWRPNKIGYTQKKSEAGAYTFEDACRIVRNANHYLAFFEPPKEAMVRIELEKI